MPRIAPSRGTHITIDADDLPLRAGAIVPVGDGRSIFALPWLGRTLVGTTDNNYDGDIDHVQPSGEDVEYLLGAVNAFFGVSLGPRHVTGAYAGVRPLVSSGDSRKSVDISRKAELYETSSGLITITGGKLTTWRRMAKLAVDRIVERDGRDAPCRTHEIPLGAPVEPGRLARVPGVEPDAYGPLAARYGHAAADVLSTAAEPAGAGAADRAPGCRTCSPRRRSRPATSRPRPSVTCCCAGPGWRCSPPGTCARRVATPRCRVATAMGAELGWDAARIATEVDRFGEEARSEGIVLG